MNTIHITDMERLAKRFTLRLLLDRRNHPKFVDLCFQNPNQPRPIMQCVSCLYRCGFGYDRIIRYLAAPYLKRKSVADWIQRRKKSGLLQTPKRVSHTTLMRSLARKSVPASRKSNYILQSIQAKEAKLLRKIQAKTQLRIKKNLRRKVWLWITKSPRSRLTPAIVGCDLQFFRHWLQTRFTHRMSWDNYGTHWHIDHILPCRLFDLRDPQQLKRCFHFSNMRPLKVRDNLRKQGRLIPCQPELLLNQNQVSRSSESHSGKAN